MPKTKLQGIVFGLLMSITMAYGMEVYNVALKSGGLSAMTNQVFLDALLETAYMWIFVFLFSNLWGNRLGHALAAKLVRPEDSPFLEVVLRSACTVLVMCPTMSLIATLLFKEPSFGVWVHTFGCNLPMALLWQMLYCGPLTRLIFRTLFRPQLAAA